MRVASWAKLLCGATCGLGCTGPSLDLPRQPEASWSVELEPHVDEQGVPLAFRGRVRRAPTFGEPWLFRGELSAYYERAVARGDIPAALRERAVALRFWREGEDCWVQPSVWLEPDASYSLAFSGVGTLRVVRAEATAAPQLRRVFPSPGSPKRRVAVVCDTRGEPLPEQLKLAPGDLSLSVAPAMGVAGAGCLTLTVQGELPEAAVSSPLFTDALLDPAPWLPAMDAALKNSFGCATGQPFYGACLEVLDDRLLVTAMDEDVLFTLSEPKSVAVVAAAGQRSSLLGGLAPQSELRLRGTALAGSGHSSSIDLRVTTLGPRRHLVLNEVLANPAGPEPDAEWIELVNDADEVASLSELWLEDSGGHVELPDAELGPGEVTLLVAESFRVSGLDVPIPEGVRLLRLPSLGARGLANGGESLLLVGREGVISRFPLLPALHPGRSLARHALSGADDDPKNFSEHGAPGASPGTANSFDAAGE
jgi:hypothetical protein